VSLNGLRRFWGETQNWIPLHTGNASIWIQQHTIYYRPVDDNPSGSASKAGVNSLAASSSTFNASRKNSKNSLAKIQNRRKPEFWADGTAPPILSPLMSFLVPKLPDLETVEDASIEVLALLRILNGLNRHWPSLYYSVPHSHIISQSDFIHSKVSWAIFLGWLSRLTVLV
jgi:E3 ubiquitin-protein ligase TRIP12